ncbi:MAG TPA: glycosyltransferase family 4 protein [Kofleriaceae bacterium]|nr:glycosyltransferase family 4 protein [Kofleriaceae bacterium]
MKLGVVTTSYPRFAGDPAGSFVAEHVAAMRADGHAVDVIAAGDGADRIASPLFYRGGAPDALERSPAATAIEAVRFTARLGVEIARRARRWDAIVAHWLAPSAIAALLATVPLLAIAHGGDVHTLRRMRLLAPVLHALRVRRARLAFVSEALRALAIDSVPSLRGWLASAIVQPMGLAIDRFQALPREPARDPATLVIASRLVPIKGVDVAIAAMAHVRTPARLVIAGDGPDRTALARCAPSNVELRGLVSTAERDRLLARASVVVVPSRVLASGRTEGTPMIALEALAAGVPVVASAVGGLRELPAVELVAPDDPRALAGAIDRVLAAPRAAPELRAGVAGLAWPAVAQRLLQHLAGEVV